jgi:hypothetical protein
MGWAVSNSDVRPDDSVICQQLYFWSFRKYLCWRFRLHWTFWSLGFLEMKNGNEWYNVGNSFHCVYNVDTRMGWVMSCKFSVGWIVWRNVELDYEKWIYIHVCVTQSLFMLLASLLISIISLLRSFMVVE